MVHVVGNKLGLCARHLKGLRLLRQCRLQSTGADTQETALVAIPEIKQFIERCMVKVSTQPAHATALAENLTAADYRGHFSHGLNRLGKLTVMPLFLFSDLDLK